VKTIKQLLAEKGGKVWTIDADATVYEALSQMAEKNIGALVVTQNDRIVGMISERDYARKVILQDRSSKQAKVADVMITRVAVAIPGCTVEEGMALMTEKRVRHLPVMDGDQLVGIVSIGDLVKAIIAEQKFIIEQLEHYIAG